MNSGVMFVPVLFNFYQYLTVCLSVISQWTRHATFLRTIPNDEKKRGKRTSPDFNIYFIKRKKSKKIRSYKKNTYF